MPSRRRRATLAGVDQLQPGDQAFTTFADDRERWDVLGLFTRLGLARGEKVMLNVGAARSPDDVAAKVAGGADAALDALGRGQLVVSDVPAFGPGPAAAGFGPGEFGAAEFDAAEVARQARARLDAAAAEGFSGVRAGCDLSASLEPFGSVARLLEFERTVHEQLMAADTGARYTALCHWDERRLSDGGALDDVRSVHPVIILPAPDGLRVTRTPAGLLLTGDADLASREQFTEALRTLEGLRPPAGETIVLDLSKLSFMDAHSVGAILRLAAGLPAPRRLEIRCRQHHRRMLNVLGARSIPRLTIITRGR